MLLLILIRNKLEEALKVYKSGSDEKFRQKEIARTNYKLGLIFEEMGDIDKADECLRTAEQIRMKENCAPANKEEDYDNLVSLWAR